MEAASTKNQKIWTCNDDMEIAIENVVTTEVNGPVTSGKGTALTVKKGINT